MRRHSDRSSYSRLIMMTEYQDKFLPPRRHTAPVLGSKNRHQYQPLRAVRTNKDYTGMMTNDRVMSARDNKERTPEMPSVRSFYMDHKWIDRPSKLPTVTNSCPRRCCCAHVCPLCTKGSKDNDLTVYKRDYQAWKLSKRQPYKLHDNLKVYQGIGVADADDKERQPIEPITSYRSSYIPHPVQPRKRHDNSVTQSSHLQLGQPMSCGHSTADPCHGLVHRFKTWTLETKLPTPGRDKYNPNRYLSTTHADYTPHKLPMTKPIMQLNQDQGISKAPFEGTTTMKDDYREWDLPRRRSTTSKKDWKRGFDQVPFSVSEAGHCARCHGNYKHLDNTAAMSQGPIENGTVGFERVAAGASGYRPGSMDGGATWMKRGMDKDRGPAHQMVSSMVSAQN